MNIGNREFKSIDQMRERLLKNAENRQGTKQHAAQPLFQGKSFKEILLSESTGGERGLRFSKHASKRLASRNINLSENQMARLSEGFDRAKQKGINESLIVVDELAFIVNIKNSLVVTAVGDSEDKIFTNIDGAVIG